MHYQLWIDYRYVSIGTLGEMQEKAKDFIKNYRQGCKHIKVEYRYAGGI
ncbi:MULTISPECIES: hypothetical protein [Bacillaceae]|nr:MULTISPECIES: hypothetical protein [Bacillus]MCX2704717.1 hypothetical protein [Bacillus sp. AS_5]BCA37406.1 hypothetical protein BwiPL1_57880 [Bacillus wiedmannii]MBT2201175.1 hypothetical protein [Bacillus thuringiensis]MCW4656978.1 hypothetical protein [Bacillus sp. AS_3]MDA2236547.1 hypothetical protein [Bacillus cereus]